MDGGDEAVDGVEIREGAPGDRAAIEALYPAAFPDEDLLPLVRALLDRAPGVLSLVAVVGQSVAGHGLFTPCGVAGSGERIALLGPLAVAPARQGQGVGSAIVRAGIARLERAGLGHVCVLGDPAYYARFGFAPETRLAPPYPLPEDWRGAWQSLPLGQAGPPRRGRLRVPEPWRRPALWAP